MGREGQTNSHNPYEPPQASQQEASGARQEPDFGGDASLSAVIERFKTLYSRGGGTLFSVWLMIMACYLPVAIFGGVIEFMSGAPAPTLETYLEPAETVNPTAPSEALGLVALIGGPLIVIFSVLYYQFFYSGMGAMRAILSGRGDRLTPGRSARMLFKRFLPLFGSLFLYGLVVFLGSLCLVVPGLLAAVLFFPVPYIVGVLGGDITDAFSEALTWFQRHWSLALCAIAVFVVYAMIGGAVIVAGEVGLGEVLGRPALILGSLFSWFVTGLGGYLAWLFTGAVLITMERAERFHF